MELDDLKHIWQSGEGQPAKEISNRIIDDITHKKHKSKMKKIRYPELAGSIVCLAAAALIGARFYQLQTIYLQVAGAVATVLLVVLPLISLYSLKQLTLAHNIDEFYAAALKQFAKQKLKFYRLQKLNVTLSCLLLVMIIILLPQFFGSKQLANSRSFWLFSFTIGYLFLMFFSKWVSNYYKNTIKQTEELLQEIEKSAV